MVHMMTLNTTLLWERYVVADNSMLHEMIFNPTLSTTVNSSNNVSGLLITLMQSYSRYGQLSGMVEPIAGLFGAVAVVVRILIN